MDRRRPETITFKADPALVEAMKGVPNRSEFIRAAVRAALAGTCPLCRGAGVLTPKQQEHWNTFARDHAVRECSTCRQMHLVCERRARP